MNVPVRVYDIHSPGVPPREEMASLLKKGEGSNPSRTTLNKAGLRIKDVTGRKINYLDCNRGGAKELSVN